MDLDAVKAASTPELVSCAIGAAVNAQGLLEDAELLSAARRRARAYALAALAVEEAGKAAGLTALAVMPTSLRAQAPLGRMLEWHQLKLVGGLLVTAVPFGSRTMATEIADLPAAQVEGMLEDAQVLAEDVDRLKQRGLYADIDRSRQVRLPSEVTETDVAALVGRARLAVSSVSVLLAPGMAAQLADPPAEGIELCRALVSAFAEAGSGRTPKAAADVMLKTVTKLQKQTAASDAWTSSSRDRRGALSASAMPCPALGWPSRPQFSGRRQGAGKQVFTGRRPVSTGRTVGLRYSLRSPTPWHGPALVSLPCRRMGASRSCQSGPRSVKWVSGLDSRCQR